jgi:putative Mn2+ efflux pump MntP
LGAGTLFLLALLVSIDSFYSGVLYKKEYGEIERSELLIIFVYVILIISSTTILGRLTSILAGEEITRLINILLLGIAGILFYIIMYDEEVDNKSKIERIRFIENTLQLKEVKEERSKTLLKLGLVTTIDVAVVSFIAATITAKILLIIIIFSSVDLFSIKAGNLVSIDKL